MFRCTLDSPAGTPESRRMLPPLRHFLTVLLISAALPAMAEEAKAPPPAGDGAPIAEDAATTQAHDIEGAAFPLGAPVPQAGRAKRKLSPMAVELLGILEAEHQALAALQIRFRQAANARAALAVQRELERVKVETELSLLRIQAGYARREGRLQHAEEIESAIREITNPPARKAVLDRPAPAAARSGASR